MARIWLSFDLGVRGDYEGMFSWLDSHGAKECADNIATLDYQPGGKSLDSMLLKDIKTSVTFTKRTRIYLIWLDQSTKSMKGKFICGARKPPAWAGFSGGDGTSEVDES